MGNFNKIVQAQAIGHMGIWSVSADKNSSKMTHLIFNTQIVHAVRVRIFPCHLPSQSCPPTKSSDNNREK